MTKIRPFVQPEKDYMRLHNSLFDVVMPTLKPNAWKLLCFIMRKTNGWNKQTEHLSYGQLRAGTGIASDATLASTIKELAEAHYIIVTPTQWQTNEYALNYDFIIAEAGQTVEDSAKPTTKIEPTSKTVATTEIEDTTETVEVPTTEIEEVPTTEIEDTKIQDIKNKEKDNEDECVQVEAPQPEPPAPLPLPAPLPVGSTGDPFMDAAKARFARGGRAVNSWQAELNLRLSADKRVPLSNAIGKACGLTALMNGDDETLQDVHKSACWFYESGYDTKEKVEALHRVYLSDDWRRKNHPRPSLESFMKFASAQLDELPIMPMASVGGGKPSGSYIGKVENLR